MNTNDLLSGLGLHDTIELLDAVSHKLTCMRTDILCRPNYKDAAQLKPAKEHLKETITYLTTMYNEMLMNRYQFSEVGHNFLKDSNKVGAINELRKSYPDIPLRDAMDLCNLLIDSK